MGVTTEATVRGLLAEHPNLDADAVDVDVEGTRVVLRGRVRTQRERDEARAVVRQIRGVDDVDDRLVVTGEPI